MAQMRVEGGAKATNLRRAVACIQLAGQGGADLVVLPEACDVGWTHPTAISQADAVPNGEVCRQLRAAACESNIHVCAGLTERSGAQVFNAAVLISTGGDVLLHHRKLNELEIGHAFYSQGDRLAVAHTALGTIGLMICADAFAQGQVISRSLGMMGAQIIVSPCAWAVPSDHDNTTEPYGKLWIDNYSPVARDFHLWIAGVSNVGLLSDGPWKGRKCIGCSLLVGPDGEKILMGPYGETAETILYADIEPRPRPHRGATGSP